MVEERPGQRQTGSKYGTVKMTVESIGIQAKIINNEEEKNGDEKKRNLLSFSTFKSNDSVLKIMSFV